MSTDKGRKLDPVKVFFSPTWFNKYYGFDYSDQAWRDPIARVKLKQEQDRVVYDRFADVGLGSRDPAPNPCASDAYGNYFMPALFGCEIMYVRDQAPGFKALDGSFEGMRSLRVPNFEKSPVMARLLSDTDALRKQYGESQGLGWINTGSPLNVAVNIYGEDFLMACAAEPEVAQHVLRVVGETMFRLYREYSAVVSPERHPLPNISWGYGNCPAVMLSPRMYREVVLPIDKWMRQQVHQFYLHHCGVFDDYIDLYIELAPTGLDIGGGSDYRAIRKAFPTLDYSLIVNPPDVEGKSVSEIDDLIGTIIEDAGPSELISQLWVPEVSEQIADETVRGLRTVMDRLPRRGDQ